VIRNCSCVKPCLAGRFQKTREKKKNSEPVGEEQAQADGLKDASQSTDCHGVKGSLFGDDLGDELHSG